jgi:hypothetical protein
MVKAPSGYPQQSPYIAIANPQAEIMMRIASECRQAPKDAAAKASKLGSEDQEAIGFAEPPKGAFALVSDVGDREPVETLLLATSGRCRCVPRAVHQHRPFRRRSFPDHNIGPAS